jgi:hypothetical protein
MSFLLVAIVGLGCEEPPIGWWTLSWSKLRPSESGAYPTEAATGVDFCWDSLLTARVAVDSSYGDGALLRTQCGLNLGSLLALGPHIERDVLIADVSVGYWRSSVFPEDGGLVTGMRIGIRLPVEIRDGLYVVPTFTMGLETLHDIDGDRDVSFDSHTVGVGLVAPW